MRSISLFPSIPIPTSPWQDKPRARFRHSSGNTRKTGNSKQPWIGFKYYLPYLVLDWKPNIMIATLLIDVMSKILFKQDLYFYLTTLLWITNQFNCYCQFSISFCTALKSMVCSIELENNTKSNFPIVKSNSITVPIQNFAYCNTKLNDFLTNLIIFPSYGLRFKIVRTCPTHEVI